MLKWLTSKVGRIVGGNKMLAECIVAVGTMLIPLGIVLVTTIDGFPKLAAYLLMIFGTVSLIVGLVIAIRKEIHTNKREKRLEERERIRRRVDKAYLILQAHMAKELGVDMDEAYKNMERIFDEKYGD